MSKNPAEQIAKDILGKDEITPVNDGTGDCVYPTGAGYVRLTPGQIDALAEKHAANSRDGLFGVKGANAAALADWFASYLDPQGRPIAGAPEKCDRGGQLESHLNRAVVFLNAHQPEGFGSWVFPARGKGADGWTHLRANGGTLAMLGKELCAGTAGDDAVFEEWFSHFEKIGMTPPKDDRLFVLCGEDGEGFEPNPHIDYSMQDDAEEVAKGTYLMEGGDGPEEAEYAIWRVGKRYAAMDSGLSMWRTHWCESEADALAALDAGCVAVDESAEDYEERTNSDDDETPEVEPSAEEVDAFVRPVRDPGEFVAESDSQGTQGERYGQKP